MCLVALLSVGGVARAQEASREAPAAATENCHADDAEHEVGWGIDIGSGACWCHFATP